MSIVGKARNHVLRPTMLSRYLMVDIVVNNVMATSTSPDYSPYMFKYSVSWLTN